MKPRVLQLFAAGINCDRELQYAFELAGAEVEQIHIRELIEQPQKCLECDLFAIPGGFTYGDDLGAGRILSLEIATRLRDALQNLHERGGSLFGVCNGFQILVKAGFLPGIEGVEVSLSWNDTHRFQCRWSRLRVEAPLGSVLPVGSMLPAASAHAEGKLVLGDPSQVEILEQAGCIAVRYADINGQATRKFPDCPSGSEGAIAGLISPSGRILGLMPHPERGISPENLPDRGRGAWGDGHQSLDFFRGLLSPYLTPSCQP
jgi:phosphoribosylformylglycinamidine synthase subunit PurQ / glutaminase